MTSVLRSSDQNLSTEGCTYFRRLREIRSSGGSQKKVNTASEEKVGLSVQLSHGNLKMNMLPINDS